MWTLQDIINLRWRVIIVNFLVFYHFCKIDFKSKKITEKKISIIWNKNFCLAEIITFLSERNPKIKIDNTIKI